MRIGTLRWIDKVLFGLLTLVLGPPVQAFSSEKRPEPVETVLLIKLWAIGDAILTLPLIRAIRKRYPAARIDVLCHRVNRAVYEASGDVDGIIEFGPGNLAGLWRKYDICLDTEPFLNLSALIAAFSAKWRVGFRNRLRWLFYQQTVSPEADSHAVQKYLEMGRSIGAEGDRELVPLKFGKGAKEDVEERLASHGITETHLLIGFCASVGNSVTSRQWPKENFRELAVRILGEEENARIVLIGTEEDFGLNEFIRDGRSRILNLSGKVGLEELFCLVASMRMFISNDTGPMHVAAAQGVPTLGLFGPSSPTLWRPYGEKNAFVYRAEEVCRLAPCNVPHKGLVRECRLKGDEKDLCIRSISVEEVYRKYREMTGRLAEGGGGEP